MGSGSGDSGPAFLSFRFGAWCAATVFAAIPVGAQGLVLTGTVRADSARVAAAEVALPTLGLATRTDSEGRYRLVNVPAGRHRIAVRAIGFRARDDTITVGHGHPLTVDVVLIRQAILLDTATTRAEAGHPISPGLRAFEERRRIGIGRFITEAELRKADNRLFSDMLRRVPGMALMRSGQKTVAVSTRRTSGAQRALDANPRSRCYTTIYQDGILLYDPVLNASSPPPDLNDFSVRDMAAIEFYAGEASIPVGFRGGVCGTILLWTRER